jgi:hypothetical protein
LPGRRVGLPIGTPAGCPKRAAFRAARLIPGTSRRELVPVFLSGSMRVKDLAGAGTYKKRAAAPKPMPGDTAGMDAGRANLMEFCEAKLHGTDAISPPRKGLEGRAAAAGTCGCLSVRCARRNEWSEAEPRKARFPARSAGNAPT